MANINPGKTTPTTVFQEVTNFTTRTKPFFNSCQVRLAKASNVVAEQVSVEEVFMSLEVQVDLQPSVSMMGAGIM